MLIVRDTQNENGTYDNLSSDNQRDVPTGFLAIPDFLEEKTIRLLPWINLIFENGVVADVVDNANAREAWEAAQTAAETKSKKLAQIETLKKQLSETDYKVTKCAEYRLAGLELPYDIAALNSERQAIRDQINALETSET